MFIKNLCAILALRLPQLSSCIVEPKPRCRPYSFPVGKTKTESHSVSGLEGQLLLYPQKLDWMASQLTSSNVGGDTERQFFKKIIY